MDSSKTAAPSSKQKYNRNAMDEFLSLYERKSEDSYAELRKRDKKPEISSNNNVQSESPNRGLSPGNFKKRTKQMVEVAQISINGTNLDTSAAGSTPLNKPKVTSTPLTTKTKDKVKPIIKHTETIVHSETMNDASLNVSKAISKKRNKSVSFLLEENEQAIVKKSKSDDSQYAAGDTASKNKAKKNKNKKNKKSEKENDGEGVERPSKITNNNSKIKHDKSETDQQGDGHSMNVDLPVKIIKGKSNEAKTQAGTPAQLVPENKTQQEDNLKGRKYQKSKNAKKRNKQPVDQEKMDLETNKQVTEKMKPKKNKLQYKSQYNNEGEPVPKASKKVIHPEVIADNLENLNLGDNTHTITNLLDEMVVVDKSKQKKKRKTANRLKKKSIDNKDLKPEAKDSVQEMECPAGEEKKWASKRWNKKEKTREQSIQIIVDNLPISLLFTYKKVLNELFSKYGLVRTVGIAEVYPTEVSQPVFATTIFFATAEDATKALEEDGTTIKGSKMRVVPSRPMTETTLVMRSYGPLTEQAIVTGMAGVGKIRSIRPIVRGGKAMSSMFVEFDGPESVERAIERCKTFKVKQKKVIVDRFSYDKKKKSKGNVPQSIKNVVSEDSKVSPRDSKVSPTDSKASPRDSKVSPRNSKGSPRDSKGSPKDSKVSLNVVDTSIAGKQEESDSEDYSDSDSDE